VIANLRKAKFLVVFSWDATHPLNDVADVLVPAAIHPEKSGTYTNLQGRVQRIEQAFGPKGEAATDLEALRRIAAHIFPDDERFRSAESDDVFEALRAQIPALAAGAAAGSPEGAAERA
jgi:NADH-quinone oxidoreductase subunit G